MARKRGRVGVESVTSSGTKRVQSFGSLPAGSGHSLFLDSDTSTTSAVTADSGHGASDSSWSEAVVGVARGPGGGCVTRSGSRYFEV